MSETSKDIAPQSCKILQTFAWWGHKLAPHHTNVYINFATLRSHIFVSFHPVTLKLGNVMDFKVLFSGV